MIDEDFSENNVIEQERKVIFKIADFIAAYWKTILSSFITLFYTIASFVFTLNSSQLNFCIKFCLYILWIVLAIIFIFIQIRLYKEKGLISNYKRINEEIKNKLELQESGNYQFWSDVCYYISKALMFGDDARISLYKNQDGIFTMLGRYSISPQYKKKGRMNYKEDEGCIGIAWNHGNAFYDELPDFTTSAKEYYKISLDKFKMNKETVDKIGMKARTIYAKAICEEQGKNRSAIVVFESINPKSFTQENIDSVFNKYESILCLAIQRFKLYEPEPSLAKEEGF